MDEGAAQSSEALSSLEIVIIVCTAALVATLCCFAVIVLKRCYSASHGRVETKEVHVVEIRSIPDVSRVNSASSHVYAGSQALSWSQNQSAIAMPYANPVNGLQPGSNSNFYVPAPVLPNMPPLQVNGMHGQQGNADHREEGKIHRGNTVGSEDDSSLERTAATTQDDANTKNRGHGSL